MNIEETYIAKLQKYVKGISWYDCCGELPKIKIIFVLAYDRYYIVLQCKKCGLYLKVDITTNSIKTFIWKNDDSALKIEILHIKKTWDGLSE